MGDCADRFDQVIVKGIIGLGCVRFESSQVQALAQDCKTDVIFNTLSLLFPFIGQKASIWWLDAVGAGLLSLHIIYDWASTCLEQVTHLTGVGADDKELKRLLYLAWRFSPVVESYKSITAYHAGDGIWCEVDLLMDEKTPLEQAHDLSETLQYCLEGLPEIDRFVHSHLLLAAQSLTFTQSFCFRRLLYRWAIWAQCARVIYMNTRQLVWCRRCKPYWSCINYVLVYSYY